MIEGKVSPSYGKYPAQNERFGLYEVFERQKFTLDISKVR